MIIPNWMEKCSIHVPNHQAFVDWVSINHPVNYIGVAPFWEPPMTRGLHGYTTWGNKNTLFGPPFPKFSPQPEKLHGEKRWKVTETELFLEPSLNHLWTMLPPLFLNEVSLFLLQFTDILKISSRNKDIRYRLPISSGFPSKKSANPEISQPCGGCFGFAVWTFPAKRPRCFQLFSRGERWEIQPDSEDK